MTDIEFRDIRWRVLVADDSKAAATAVRRAIEEFQIGCEVTEVQTGAECLAELATHRYHVAFVDVIFPDINGLEALGKARDNGISTFVTMMSGRRDAEALAKAKALKAYDFIGKPFVTADVIRILDAYAHAGRRRRMLIVDGSDTQRKLMGRVVSRGMFPFDIEEAADGITGFEMFAALRPDLALVDLAHAPLNGLDTLRLFRAHKPDAELVMVGGDREALAAAGATRWLPKPFDESDVDDLMHAVLGLRQPFAV
ncbi:MAG TPA: response regulator [Methylomirabilota bacterium]|nr:response regulator [Methylomirabilota bacterium]